MHVYPIYCKYWSIEEYHGCVSSISDVLSIGEASATGFLPKEVAVLRETLHGVPLPHRIPSQCLTPLVVRAYPTGPARGVAHGTES